MSYKNFVLLIAGIKYAFEVVSFWCFVYIVFHFVVKFW